MSRPDERSQGDGHQFILGIPTECSGIRAPDLSYPTLEKVFVAWLVAECVLPVLHHVKALAIKELLASSVLIAKQD